jgi:alkylation response protein AidB-like acyl-CoA dehydrogenase
MDLDLTEDQVALREMVEDFVTKESTVEAVREAEPLGFSAGMWRKVVDMGLVTIAVPEQLGGGGAGFLDLALAVEHFGRTLAPVPLIEASVANHVLASLAGGAGDAATALLNDAVAGDALVTLALRPAVDGVATIVPGGAVADAVIALDGDELVAVRQSTITPSTPADAIPNLGALPIADRDLRDGERIVLARGPEAVAAHRRAVGLWEALTANALVGAGQRALEIGLEYVMERKAFGVLIGTFQTIQHRFADDVTALDGARMLAYEAAWAHDVGQDNAAELATMAFLYAGEATFKTAAESLQFHGGYGYTLEYDIQLYFRRAKAWVLVAGDPKARYAELAHRVYGEKGA